MIDKLESAWHSLVSSFCLKSALSILGGVTGWLIGIKHVQVLGIFTLLVIIDLVTKWSSIAYQMLVEKYEYDPHHIAVWEKYRAIPTAFEFGLIKSEYMRKGFCQKIFTYVIATAVAFLFDLMSGQHGFAVNLVWLYLGSSEFLSILENLRDGGNTSMGKFLELVKSKVENKVKV